MGEENKTAVDGLSREEYNRVMEGIIKAARLSGEEIQKYMAKKHKEVSQKKLTLEETKELLRENYGKIIQILRKYVDMREDYYPLVAVWIIGTYFHKEFESYPYLFLNAMKGSGKTRLLKLIAALSRNGKVLASLREAVLFRTAGNSTICIDEFESLGSKEKGDLRELLNAAYKKGIRVERMKKVATDEGSEQVVEAFDVFCPIAMANIWGMEDVLGDRCIHLTLEKVSNPVVTKLIEDFLVNLEIQLILTSFSIFSVVGVVMCATGGIVNEWNEYVIKRYDTPNNTTTLTTETTQTTLLPLFEKINNTKIDGRNLELFFPLFILAYLIGDDVLDDLLKIGTQLVEERKCEEVVENKDINFIEYISKQEEKGFIEIKTLTQGFKQDLHEEDEDIKWINAKWVGRALKRLNFIKMKRRIGKGREVILDIERAKKQIKIFRPFEKPSEQEQQELEVKHEKVE